MLKKILTVFIEVFLGSSALLTIPINCLHIFGLWGIFRKCGVKPWKALIPFVREYNLALCADHEMEGRALAVMSVLTTVSNLIYEGFGVNFP